MPPFLRLQQWAAAIALSRASLPPKSIFSFDVPNSAKATFLYHRMNLVAHPRHHKCFGDPPFPHWIPMEFPPLLGNVWVGPSEPGGTWVLLLPPALFLWLPWHVSATPACTMLFGISKESLGVAEWAGASESACLGSPGSAWPLAQLLNL